MDRSEVYGYDGLSRLTTMNRGTLNAAKTAIEGTPAREETWSLNQTGNWSAYHTKVHNSGDTIRFFLLERKIVLCPRISFGLADFVGLDVKVKGKFLVPGEKLAKALWMPPNNLCNKACCYEVAVKGQMGFNVYGYTALFKVAAAGAAVAAVALPEVAAEVGAEILISTPVPALAG